MQRVLYAVINCARGESGSDVDILCPRCGKLIQVIITQKDVRAVLSEFWKNPKEIR